MKPLVVFVGRAWRNLNRRVSRLYLDRQVKPGQIPLERLGSTENGWYAPRDLAPETLCYCLGVGLDASFDFALAERGAKVHAFDPTPKSIAYMARENRGRVAFHQWAVLNRDGTMRLYAPLSEAHGSHFAQDLHRTGKFHEVPCLRLATIRERLDHPNPWLMKMDIEASWYEALPDIIEQSTIRPRLLEVEYDSPAPPWRVSRIHRLLAGAGYRLVLRARQRGLRAGALN